MWKERFVGLLWWIDGLRGGGFFLARLGLAVCCVVLWRGIGERGKGRKEERDLIR